MTDTHRMDRRSAHHHYCWVGMYHVTVKVNKDLCQPLGRVVGNIGEPDGSPDAPRVELSETGRMVEQELTTSITAHYPMIEIQEHVVMPDHLHFIVAVRRTIVSASGRETHLGQVIAGFKKGCNRRYWELAGITPPQMGSAMQRGKPAVTGPAAAGAATAGPVCLAVHPQGSIPPSPECAPPPQQKRTPSNGTTGRAPLFSYGYVDVMPVDEEQLQVQRRYIRNNPRSRLMRTLNRAWLQPQRQVVATALYIPALKKYLTGECSSAQLDDAAWVSIQQRLLTVNGQVVCDSYGNRQLLQKRLLPVVCHRRDASLLELQKSRCLAAAQNGAVLVSARIAKGEQAIMDEAIAMALPVVLVCDNGFPQTYHPSEKRIGLCAAGQLLLLTPWQFYYRRADEEINVVQCKTMNCVAQALCRTKDSWWKHVNS